MTGSASEAGAVLTALARRLAGSGAESPRLEAELLVSRVLGCERLALKAHPERVIDDAMLGEIAALAARREKGEPMAYLLGFREFYGRDFKVAPGVLIPRPETELLVETALELMPEESPVRFADLGSGSGCIGITLALERPLWRGVLVEKMPEPARLSQINARALGAQGITVIQADFAFPSLEEQSLDLVLANPPYIAEEERAEVEPGVLAYEPAQALFAERHGLADLEACASLARRCLAPGGALILEHGLRQEQSVRAMLAALGFSEIFTKKDLAGLDRVTLGRV